MASRTWKRAGAWSLALVFGLAVGARAQDDAIPEADPIGDGGAGAGAPGDGGGTGRQGLRELTPVQDEPAATESGGGGPGFGANRNHVRLSYQHYRIPVEIDHFRDDGVSGLGTRQFNRRTDWQLEKSSFRFEAGRGFGSDNFEVDVYGGLGFGWTDLELDARTGSGISPGGPHISADIDSDIDFDLVVGAEVWAFISRTVFVNGSYQLLYSHASFDEQVFIGIPTDASMDSTIHDVAVRFGARVIPQVSVWAGVGFVATWAEVDLDPKGPPFDVDFELESETWIKGLIGAAIHAGEHATARMEVAFMPEPNFTFSLGWSF